MNGFVCRFCSCCRVCSSELNPRSCTIDSYWSIGGDAGAPHVLCSRKEAWRPRRASSNAARATPSEPESQYGRVNVVSEIYWKVERQTWRGRDRRAWCVCVCLCPRERQKELNSVCFCNHHIINGNNIAHFQSHFCPQSANASQVPNVHTSPRLAGCFTKWSRSAESESYKLWWTHVYAFLFEFLKRY